MLSNLGLQPDRLIMRMAERPALKNAILWDADGNLVHPSNQIIGHPSYEMSDKEIRRLTKTHQQLSDVAYWGNFDAEKTYLVYCEQVPAVCLIYDRHLLEQDHAVWLSSPIMYLYGKIGSVFSIVIGFVIVLFAFGRQKKSAISANDFEILPESHLAKWGSCEVSLSPRDLKLLMLLKEREGEVVTKDELYDAGWGRDYMPNSRALDQHIINLRRKLDPGKSRPKLIETVHGVGYRFCI